MFGKRQKVYGSSLHKIMTSQFYSRIQEENVTQTRLWHNNRLMSETSFTFSCCILDRLLAKSLQSCPTLCDPIDGSPPGSPVPGTGDSPGQNTGVGFHFLLQCVKVKSESEVTQLYPTLSDPMDCSLPGSSVHGIFQARVLEWGAIAFSSNGQITYIPSNFGFLLVEEGKD